VWPKSDASSLVTPESAESAIGFGRRLQRREIAGLMNMGSCSSPSRRQAYRVLNRRSRIAQKEPNQFALSLNSGFGKNTLNLRTNGIISYAGRIRYLPGEWPSLSSNA
jgi:hypothetical protein